MKPLTPMARSGPASLAPRDATAGVRAYPVQAYLWHG
jgi:hypothetical protein